MGNDGPMSLHWEDHAFVEVSGSRFLAGTSSWADRSLVADGTFYPRRSMTARARLGFYASRFPLAEVATTYRFPPTPAVAMQWAERTPEEFTFDVRAWSLLSGAPTIPDSLWPDMQGLVDPRFRDLRRLYPHHLPDGAIEECWARFAEALQPLKTAGKLGVVILQYPGWFTPRPEAWEELALARDRLPEFRVAVELRSSRWTEGEACEETLGWLEEHDLSWVCVDGPAEGPRSVSTVAAATSEVAVVRFSGRRFVDDEPWTAPYRYSDVELSEWAGRIVELAQSAREVHAIMDNCWRADAVDNAAALACLVRDASR